MRIAIIGQSQFAVDVYKLLKANNHKIVGIFTIPDLNGKSDPLAIAGDGDGVQVFKFPRWRLKGQALPEVVDQYKSVDAQLNVMPYCSQFIPLEVINLPEHKSIVYHPSILPRHRGASAINWTLIQGDAKAGFSIFWADDGLDTGPLLLQRACDVQINDTLDSLYNRFLYPEGVKAMGEAVNLIASGKAPCTTQTEEGATYDPMIKKATVKIDWNQTALQIHNFIRGNDKVPGAWAEFDDQQMTFYGSELWNKAVARGDKVSIAGLSKPAIVHADGLLICGIDDKWVNVKSLKYESGKMIAASNYGKQTETATLELTKEEKDMVTALKGIWKAILSLEVIEAETDFFKSGAGSMDVVRLVEEVKEACSSVQLENEHVYMSTTFTEFSNLIVLKSRGEGDGQVLEFDAIEMNVNKRDIRFPHQIFINNQFFDSSDDSTFDTINPANEEVICKVSKGTVDDVNYAVDCAETAFNTTWKTMNARDRGTLMYRLADEMEAHKEELATLESLDSGAVYTLALKTHIGMSIDTFRYFAGWCDKVQGSTIPINNARPNKNLTYTKREPIGVCGIITPWNYPLMMLAWKMAACLAAGNCVVLKPAQVTPLTSLKFAELVVKAGFPAGVINIIPGSGRVVGQAMADHPKIRKLGFTGSTEVGKTIMQSCGSSNLKKCSLELGGKSPLIILSDCDFEKAVRMGLNSVFFNKGENCIAAGRIFVEETIYDEYIRRVVEEVKKMKIGDPLDRGTEHGPQNHKAHLESLIEYCKKGIEEKATLNYGGHRLDRPGYYFAPTVFSDVTDDMFIAQEESFGPVMIISKFTYGDIEGVLESANRTEYGLAAGVFTTDLSKALRVSDQLQAGTVFVNTYNKTDVAAPFGGCKQSGFGKDLGQEALNEYLKTKTVTVEY